TACSPGADNRDNSNDSRYWGTLPRACSVGRATKIYWSWDNEESWLRMLDPAVVWSLIRTKTRWDRIGQSIESQCLRDESRPASRCRGWEGDLVKQPNWIQIQFEDTSGLHRGVRSVLDHERGERATRRVGSAHALHRPQVDGRARGVDLNAQVAAIGAAGEAHVRIVRD